MQIGTWNVRSLYRTGAVVGIVKEVGRYNLDIVRLQEVRLPGEEKRNYGTYTLFHGKGNVNHAAGTGFLVSNKIKSTVKEVNYISDRLSYLRMKGRWCDIIITNAYE